ncbi:MAG: FecR family protein [Desulfobaccales bacterium]|jgi:ribosomal protein S28E/S33
MIRRCYIRFYLISIMMFMISLPIWARAGEVGNFTQVEQRVDYQKGQRGPVIPAKVKQAVEVNDVIQTYDVSRAQVLFRDKTTITIAPKSKVAVESYMFDPAKFERSGNFDLIQGVMKVVVPAAEMMQKTSFDVKTSTATLGIRGTEFVVISGTNFSVVYSIKGRVALKSNPKEPGKYSVGQAAPGGVLEKGEVYLDPGMMSVILANQLPSSPQPVTPAVLAAAEGLVTTGINDTPGSCVLSTLPGVDLVSITNDLMSRGANPDALKESLSLVCYALPGTITSGTTGPPVAPAGVGPTFPGGGGGGGAGVASPSS